MHGEAKHECPQSFIDGVLDRLYGDQNENPAPKPSDYPNLHKVYRASKAASPSGRKPQGKIIQFSEYTAVAK